jgi:hypothetical protein
MTDVERLAQLMNMRSIRYDLRINTIVLEKAIMKQLAYEKNNMDTAHTREKLSAAISDALNVVETVRFLFRISDAEIADMRHWRAVRMIQEYEDPGEWTFERNTERTIVFGNEEFEKDEDICD